ncbi:hypothetical protein CROQUDRAFT_721703 [Cronartium quercuum f. sp. fusiforme G11]|uniref:Uncharacterized protein n=1 Tax=Cronartium quercuum f. sp. fusiforme G11 TaxID=708437 RepID=A0A9P6NQM1_9BASI|nr:hypothetical protein CROQUDRAFT_721703 [Cronartium quercuum f. sp. fusiforme G11]
MGSRWLIGQYNALFNALSSSVETIQIILMVYSRTGFSFRSHRIESLRTPSALFISSSLSPTTFAPSTIISLHFPFVTHTHPSLRQLLRLLLSKKSRCRLRMILNNTFWLSMPPFMVTLAPPFTLTCWELTIRPSLINQFLFSKPYLTTITYWP